MKRISPIRRYRRGFPHGLMFHRFHASPESDWWQGALTPEEFESILLYAGIENILSPDEWMSRLEQSRLSEGDLCLTFDDGLRCQVEYALPVLERYGLRAFWFVCSCVFRHTPIKSELYSYAAGQICDMSDFVQVFLERCPADMRRQLHSPQFAWYSETMRKEYSFYTANDLKYRFLRNRFSNTKSFEQLMEGLITEQGLDLDQLTDGLWLDEADLKALVKRGHHVGLHSYDHPFEMAQLGYDEQRRQYEMNYRQIVTATQLEPRTMAHPLNSYSHDTLEILNQLGVRCGFRSNPLPPVSKPINPTCFEMAREDASTIISMIKAPESLYGSG